MLHFETVEPWTLSLLRRLQNIPELKHFYLAGGTALSLIYGHRTSIDLDLFGEIEFDKEKMALVLEDEFKEEFRYEAGPPTWGMFCYIGKVKVDILNYQHPPIAAYKELEGVRMFSVEDIIAMKLNAILGRGTKKDLWDISELLDHYTLAAMIDLHQKKFPSQMLLISIPQALLYFDDAEESGDPVSLKGQSWDKIKNRIREKVRDYLS